MADEHLISLQPGTVIGGKYEVVKCLGSGSMGLVYACRHRELPGHMVAVKVLFPEVAQDKVAAARFRNEVFASYGVSHPNVVRAYEYVRDGELVAYTMEYVNGGDLAERLNRQERIPIPEIIRILSQMCAGVQAIHDSQIVHRDLKPENILLTKDGNVKIADFGIARNRFGPKLTEHGGVVGTIDYVSPEYMLNSQVDWRSDIYALGILAYEMVMGESPFKGDSVYATMTKRLKTDPEPPSKSRNDCPPLLDQIILRAMHRDPLLRYQSGMEMFFDLQKLAAELGLKSAITGGFFMASQNQASSYVGPSLFGEEKEESADQVNSTLQESVPQKPKSTVPASSSGLSNSGGSLAALADDARAYQLSTPTKSTPAYAAGGGFGVASSEYNSNPPANNGTTKLVSSEIGELASQIEEQQRPLQNNRMEQVLNYNDLVSDNWNERSQAIGVTMNGGAISQRFRNLSERYQEVQNRRSLLVDSAIFIVAMAVGIGFGLFVLRVFFPDLLESIPFLGGKI